MSRSRKSEPPKVVIVEDDGAVLGSLGFAFEVQGFEVLSYSSAESLLAAPSLPERCCLILDYWLPGMNGLALLSQLRKSGRDLPAILITTANPELHRRAALAGVTLIDKPLASDDLIARVRDLLDPARRPDGGD
jgi:FixJ family two-component response regulator